LAKYDFRAPRLYLDAPIAASQELNLGREQAHYLRHVLRLEDGAEVVVFNGRDGEWQARLVGSGKRDALLRAEKQIRLQPATRGPVYAFAPLKHARLDYVVQKAVEMGASRLAPVFTQHTQVNRMNMERMRANAVEAAEQCGMLSLPEIDEPRPLDRWVDSLESDRVLVFCDEDEAERSPVDVLAPVKDKPIALLVGPEGGFSEAERAALRAKENVIRLSLGPRILRADTAAVAALALVQAVCGDWR
jgi:16S rRNA (uracil1498-N3)-methyltransferase